MGDEVPGTEESDLTLFADQHPEALQTLADPTVKVAEGLDERLGWQVPVGWIGVVNSLRVDIIELLGDYEVIRAGNKMSYPGYAIDRHRRPHRRGQGRIPAHVRPLRAARRGDRLIRRDLLPEAPA